MGCRTLIKLYFTTGGYSMVGLKNVLDQIQNFIQELLCTNKSVVNVVMLVSLTSIVYIYPFGSYFRFTFAIILLMTLLLYFDHIPILSSTIITGLVILVFRITTEVLTGEHEYLVVLMSNSPALAYYISFGVLFYLLSIRERTNNVLLLILLLSITDIISNVVELLFRSELVVTKLLVIIPSIVAVAVIRAILAVVGYYALKQYRSFILANDQAKRYVEQTVMIAKLKSELFYLEKSSQDIENVMEKAYWLYKELNSKEIDAQDVERVPADQALSVAREIHEIKKDYNRVIAGIENILSPSSKKREVKLSEILFIIEQNTMRYLQVMDKNMRIVCEVGEDFITNQHYTLVSILDNLIMNAIEACGDYGTIRVIQSTIGEEVLFCVEDNGTGIDEKDLDFIFDPGYSTKFSPHTGKISTGLGLSHVKNHIELLGGSIRVESQAGPGLCTKFFITLPRSSIICVRK